MDWKQFFKPTAAKIVVAFVVFLIFVPFINYDNGVYNLTTGSTKDSTGSIIIWLFSPTLHIYQIFYVNLIVGVLLSYLVSCTILHVKDRKR